MSTNQNCPPGCIPFDLETAIKHPERVRTERGDLRGVRVVHFPEADRDNRVGVVWNYGGVSTYTFDGRVAEDFPSTVLFLTAPEPKLVPWESIDEIPNEAWFRNKKYPRFVFKAAGFYLDGQAFIDGSWCTLAKLFNVFEYHTDRRHKGPWNVCGKPEAKQ